MSRLRIAEIFGPTIQGEGALIGKLEGAGVPVARLTAEEEAAWRASSDSLRTELAKELGPKAEEILAQIQEAKAACGS